MAPKQRQVRIEQRGAQQAIEALEQRSDEELEAETKYKSAALAILGARASERFDAEQARGYFQRAIAAARPQERMQLRRMADASLALAERRAGDLKDAVERLGTRRRAVVKCSRCEPWAC
jgi:tetratricopeptide (TPR) repeat protein